MASFPGYCCSNTSCINNVGFICIVPSLHFQSNNLRNTKVNTHQICSVPNPLNFVTLNNSHPKVQLLCNSKYIIPRAFPVQALLHTHFMWGRPGNDKVYRCGLGNLVTPPVVTVIQMSTQYVLVLYANILYT